MSFHTLTLAIPNLMLSNAMNGTGYEPIIGLTKKEQILFRQRMLQSVERYWTSGTSGTSLCIICLFVCLFACFLSA